MSAAGLVATEHVAETGSTNADLLDAVRRADPALPFAPRLLVAGRQTAGRGRHGRAWQGAEGASLTFSLAWPLQAADISGLSGLSLAVGVALAESLDPTPGRLRIGLKWPNDLWLVEVDGDPRAGRKLAGVLIETMPLGAGRVAVIGIGLNVSEQQVHEAAHGAAWLREIGPDATPASALARVTPALVDALQTFAREGWRPFAARFAARDVLGGCSVVAGAVEGVAAGVSARGELLLRTADGVRAVGSGDVRLRIAAAPVDLDASAAALPSSC